MTEAVEFDVPDAGAPNLGDQEGQQPDPSLDAAAPVAPPGWTQQEAARVIGGMVAGITTALYVFKHQAPPAVELVPYIAGDPEREFPLLGMSLAPILDLIAPKGSAAAVGVGLGAGISELMGAMARRMPVLATPPAKSRPSAPAPAAEPSAAASSDGGEGFRFKGDALRVLQQQETEPLAGIGLS